MAYPGFAKRLPNGDSTAGFIAAAKRGEAFKSVSKIGGAHTSGKPRKRGGRSGNGEDVGDAARQRLPQPAGDPPAPAENAA